MELMTPEVEEIIKNYPLYSQDSKKGEAVVVCKYFLPIGCWTWYVLEGNRQTDGDYHLFGIVINGEGEREYGYFMLSELQELRVTRLGLKVERDLYLPDNFRVKDID